MAPNALCTWQMATARASAASWGAGAASRPSNNLIIAPTCAFSARPKPTTARLISAGEYSATVSPAWDAASSATPRACPSFRPWRTCRAWKTFSMATQSGRCSASSAARPAWMSRSRSGNVACAGAAIVPKATSRWRRPSVSTQPYPVRPEPGSIPKMITTWSASSAGSAASRQRGLDLLFLDVGVRPDLLGVLVLFEILHQLEHLLRRLALEPDVFLRHQRDLA